MKAPNLKYLPKSEYFFGIFFTFFGLSILTYVSPVVFVMMSEKYTVRKEYTVRNKCIDHMILLGIGYKTWLICDNEDASKKLWQ